MRDMKNTSQGCTVAGCGSPHAARGYCRTHYSRWLRHGDPLVVKPVGRRTDSNLAMVRDLFREWGSTTISRHHAAIRVLGTIGDGAPSEGVLAATRANGSFNVAALERFTTQRVIEYCNNIGRDALADKLILRWVRTRLTEDQRAMLVARLFFEVGTDEEDEEDEAKEA